MSRAVYDYNSVDWNSIFYYDPDSKTGLRWKVDRVRGKGVGVVFRKAGDEAGSIHFQIKKNSEYAMVNAKEGGGKNFFAHRVIWIMHNGPLDKELVVDHINGNSLDNRIENLRVVKQANNNRNSSIRKDNCTGIRGVHFTTAAGGEGCLIKDYYTFATANWHETVEDKFVSKCKHFSVKKYGLLPAFAMACKYREDKIEELNSLGYGYTENHGK